MDNKKVFIINQYKDNKRVLSRSEIEKIYREKEEISGFVTSLINLKSPASSCGDEIDFLVWKENGKIEKINFSNENCCIITGAAANIASSYLETNNLSGDKMAIFISNVEKMITGAQYNKNDIKEFESFSGIENIYGRSSCLKIVIDLIKKVV